MAEEKKNYEKEVKKKTRKNNKDIEKIKQELKEEVKKELLEEMRNKHESKKEEKKFDSKEFEKKAKETVDKIMDTEDNTNYYDKEDIEQNKLMSILAYFGPLSLIPYFVSKESKFAQYHAKQGLNLFIIESVVGVFSYFLTLIFQISKMCGSWGCEVFTPFWITIPINFVQTIIGVIALIGLIYACQGKAKEVPILGKFKIIK